MDGGDRRQSQYGAPYQPSGSGRPAAGQPMGPPPSEQYSQSSPSPSRSSMSAHAQGRQYLPQYDYHYQQPGQYQQQLQYPTAYIQSSSRQNPPGQTQQQYAGFAPGTMLPPMGQPSLYEGMHPYQAQRQSTAVEVMAGQFGAAGMQYLSQSEPNSAIAVGQQPTQYLSSQPEQQAYGSMAFARPQLQPPFTGSSMDYLTLEQSVPPQAQEETNNRQAVEQGRTEYERQLRSTFEAIIAGRLIEACEKLTALTEWLFGSIRALGLHHDEEGSHDQRIIFWRELNHAWEALGMMQKTTTENAIRLQQQPAELLSATQIRALLDKLIQLCDQVEKYGLVDYEMGIWEEQIVDVFIQCLELLPQEQAPTGSTSH